MAEIKLSELRPAGSELLQDSENFLNELSDREIENVVGGDTIASVASQNSISVGTVNSITDVGQTQTFVTHSYGSVFRKSFRTRGQYVKSAQ